MSQLVYAAAGDYEDLAEEPFENPGENDARLNKRLRAASIEVQKLTRLAVYDVDEDGYPTDPDVADAFTEATCAIVEYWEETDDPTGSEANAGAVKIGSVSLGTTSSRESDDNGKTARRIGTRAGDILRNAGLSADVSY